MTGWLVLGGVLAALAVLYGAAQRRRGRAEERAEEAEDALREAEEMARRRARPLPDDDHMRGLGMPDASE